ncbi:hypothetical protein DDW13_01755 [Acidianus hospitalis]|uniref:DUF4322 domain-containing protein n=1 Tax=Acidianus hospitalis TaxID=563177 RepID=A0A2T9XA07_9CREN|nr:hypothetical protein DDW13_01755 [Acidianus hospitalis]
MQQIGYKLLSMLDFQGEEVAKTLISACLRFSREQVQSV